MSLMSYHCNHDSPTSVLMDECFHVLLCKLRTSIHDTDFTAGEDTINHLLKRNESTELRTCGVLLQSGGCVCTLRTCKNLAYLQPRKIRPELVRSHGALLSSHRSPPLLCFSTAKRLIYTLQISAKVYTLYLLSLFPTTVGSLCKSTIRSTCKFQHAL